MEWTIVVLANSIKKHERCVAGKELIDAAWGPEFGTWIRPVSRHGEGELSFVERRCQDGRDAQVLDIVTIPLMDPMPTHVQPENWQIDSTAPWQRIGRLGRAVLPALLETPPHLWAFDGYGRDRIEEAQVAETQGVQSLYLINPSGLKIRTEHGHNPFRGYHQKKALAAFSYRGLRYQLKITDPAPPFTLHFPERDGAHLEAEPPRGDDYYLCVSLTEAFNGYHYKLVASVIEA